MGRHGAEILAVYRIARRGMESSYLLKNDDFTHGTVRDLMAQGEQRALEELKVGHRRHGAWRAFEAA